MNPATVQHRWANKDFGKYGTLTASSSCHSEGRNYYSYSTVFGQWLDLTKNVVAIFDGKTSKTSSKYKLYKGLFPSNVHIFPISFAGGYYEWNNCNVVSSYSFNDEDFKEYHRMKMIDHYVERIYNQIAAINGGTSKGLEKVDFSAWKYIEELCSLYKDTTIPKYIKYAKKNAWKDADGKLKLNLVKMLKDGERNVQVITDALFGDGTFNSYMNYSERFRKADKKRIQTEWLCHRLAMNVPGTRYSSTLFVRNPLSAKEVRALTAKERIDLHFRNLETIERLKDEDNRKKLYSARKRNAYKWITGYEPVISNIWSGSYESVTAVRNMFNGEVYNVDNSDVPVCCEWHKISVEFEYDSFRKSDDKKQWIDDFYEECRTFSELREAYRIFSNINADYVNGSYSWIRRYVDNERLSASTTPEEYAICKKFIERQEKFYADLEAQKRAEAIRRQREEEERKREKELQEKLKAEQIQECLENGVEGGRNLWRFHYMNINEAKRRSDIPDLQFFDGGNVLMRFNMDKTIVETSKNIKLDIPTCKKFWGLINIWHKDPSKFKECEINTHYSGTYEIISYENDILTAGCHEIAYSEMERMYNEIVEHEKSV